MAVHQPAHMPENVCNAHGIASSRMYVCVYLLGWAVERIIEFSETPSSVTGKLFSMYEAEYLICLCRHLC